MEVDPTTHLAVRIFRSVGLAVESGIGYCLMQRSDAVTQIRLQVYDRAGGKCEIEACPNRISWETMHMHEVQPKGMTNFELGEVSLENCQGICPNCHGQAHKHRTPQWSRKNHDQIEP